MSGWVDFACYLVAFFFLVYGGYRAGTDLFDWVSRRRSKREHYDKLFRKEG